VGEYIGRIYQEVRHRPRFIVRRERHDFQPTLKKVINND